MFDDNKKAQESLESVELEYDKAMAKFHALELSSQLSDAQNAEELISSLDKRISKFETKLSATGRWPCDLINSTSVRNSGCMPVREDRLADRDARPESRGRAHSAWVDPYFDIRMELLEAMSPAVAYGVASVMASRGQRDEVFLQLLNGSKNVEEAIESYELLSGLRAHANQPEPSMITRQSRLDCLSAISTCLKNYGFSLPSVPHHFICSLTLQLMNNPVKAKDGFVYERFAIIAWLHANSTSPLTHQFMSEADLECDSKLDKKIDNFLSASEKKLDDYVHRPKLFLTRLEDKTQAPPYHAMSLVVRKR